MKVWCEYMEPDKSSRIVHYFRADMEFEAVIAKKYLSWSPREGAYSDNGDSVSWVAFEKAYDVAIEILNAYCRDMAKRVDSFDTIVAEMRPVDEVDN